MSMLINDEIKTTVLSDALFIYTRLYISVLLTQPCDIDKTVFSFVALSLVVLLLREPPIYIGVPLTV